MYIDLKPFWLKYDTLLSYETIEDNKELCKLVLKKVQDCFDESRSFMSLKVRDWMWLDEQEKNNIKDWKIKSQDMHQARKMYCANFMNEWLYPVIEWVEYWDQMLAGDLTKIAKSDTDKMRLWVRFKQLTDNMFNYWMSVIIEDYVDNINKVIVPKVISPMSYYPDPLGNYIDNNFRRHLFWTLVTKSQLHEMNDRSMSSSWEKVYHEIDDLMWWYNFDEQYKFWTAKNIRWYSQISNSDEIYVTQWFIEINWYKYAIMLGNANNTLVSFIPLEPLTPSEKKDRCTIPFPVAIISPYPIENDICWVAPRELMFDFARAINKIVNSVYRKELRNAWGDVYFVDSNINLADVAVKEDTWPVFVPYAWFREVPNPMVKASEYSDTAWSMNFYNWLKSRGQENTGITDIQLWNPDQNATLWQMQQQLSQSDIMFGLDVDMICEGMKYFWLNIRLRWLRKNIKTRKEKYLSITWYMWQSTIIKLNNSKFVWSDDPDIRVVSKRKQLRESKAKLLQLQSFYPLEQADPNTAKIVNKMFKRDMYRLAWFEEDQVLAYCPLDASERHSIKIMDIVNEDIMPKVPIIPWLDLQTLWIYINMCVDNDTKLQMLTTLNRIMIEEWIEQPVAPEQQWWPLSWLQNSMSSQMLSKSLSQPEQQPWSQPY